MKVTLSVATGTLAGSHLLTAICSPESQVTSVQFFVDNAPVGPADTTPSFTYLWDTTTVADGIHYVEARASFTRSRTASSPRQQVTVLNTEPDPEPTVDPPVNVTLPVIGGTPTEGQTLTVSLGEWTNNPDSYTRQWLRCGGGGYATEILADSPVAWWRMDDLTDSSANSNTLTVVGSVPTIAGLIAGDSSLGRNFTNSTANYLTAVDHATLDLGDTFSLEAWVKLSALNTHGMIVSKGNNAYEWFVNSSTNQIICGKSDVGAFVTSSIALTVGVVYHVVVTKAAGTAKLYINGVDRTGTTAAQTLANNAEVLAIGRYNETANFPFSGVIDEVAFYSTALSAARVLVHYNAGASAHSCVPIPSASGVTYVAANADVGRTLRVAVTAYNGAGASPTVETNETAVVAELAPAVPTIISPPSISGVTVVGNTMSCTTGSWSNSPTDYDYQWKRCTSAGGSCFDIAGATFASYVLTTADAGATVKCGVTASNSAGASAQQNSNLSALVTAGATGATGPSGVLLWNADLTTGDRSQYGNWEWAGMYDGVPPLTDRVAVATTIDGYTPAQGTHLMRIRCPGNEFISSSSNSRTMTRLPPEYTNGGQIKVRSEGYDTAYTWVGMVPPGYMTGILDTDIFLTGPEWVHTSGAAVGTGTTPHHFRWLDDDLSTDVKWFDGTNWHYEVGGPSGFRFLQNYVKGAWYVFTERYKMGVAPNGIYQLWYGKKGTHTTMQQVVNASGIGTMHPANRFLYMVYGNYRRYTGSATDMVYYNGGFREYSTSAGALGWAEQILRG